MKLDAVAQMQKIEKDAAAGALTYDQMMENENILFPQRNCGAKGAYCEVADL